MRLRLSCQAFKVGIPKELGAFLQVFFKLRKAGRIPATYRIQALDQTCGCLDQSIYIGVFHRGGKPAVPAAASTQGKGFTDGRFGVFFPEGFEIFRVFKGNEIKAVVRDSLWYRADINRVSNSLNQLSAQIGAPTENAWRGWYYRQGDKSLLIDTLRDRNKITKRQGIKWT
jgi:hypothetical protein